jgi:hypothetical protein
MGTLLTVVVHSAGIQERAGARAVLIRLFGIISALQEIRVDGGYCGKLLAWARAMFGWCLKSSNAPSHGWQITADSIAATKSTLVNPRP